MSQKSNLNDTQSYKSGYRGGASAQLPVLMNNLRAENESLEAVNLALIDKV